MTADVCRKHEISSATFYAWKAKFGGLEVSDAKRLKPLADENAKLKRLLADAMLDGPVVIETFAPEIKEIARAVSIWRPSAESQDALAANGLRNLRAAFGA